MNFFNNVTTPTDVTTVFFLLAQYFWKKRFDTFDFVCGEVAWFLCLERLRDFSHSLTQSGYMIYFSWGCVIFFRRGCMIFFWRGCVIFCWEIPWFCVWRGCMNFLCEEVAWRFVLRGYMICCVKGFFSKKNIWWKQFFLGKKVFWWNFFLVTTVTIVSLVTTVTYVVR